MIFCSLVWFFQCCGDYSCLGYASLECCLSSIILLYTMNISIHTNIYIHLLYYLLSCFSLSHAYTHAAPKCVLFYGHEREHKVNERERKQKSGSIFSLFYIYKSTYIRISECAYDGNSAYLIRAHITYRLCVCVLCVRGWKTVANPRSTHRVIHSIHRIICG